MFAELKQPNQCGEMKQVTETHTTGTATGSLSCCVSNLSLLRPCSRDLLYFRLVRREDSADKGPQGHRQTICFQSPCLPRASTSGNTWRDSRGGHGRQPGSRHPGLTTRERREQNSNDPSAKRGAQVSQDRWGTR